MSPSPAWRGLVAVLRLMDGRWVLAILEEVTSEAKRHSELLGAIDGISEKVLTETLRRMERDGLVERKVEPGVSNHVVYRATTLARSLDGPLRELALWREEHWHAVDAARSRWEESAGNQHSE